MNRVDGCYADPVKGLKYRWTEPLVGEEVSVLSGNLPPLLSRLLRARGIETEHDAEKYLYPRLNHMHDPLLLPDMGKAAERLVKAVRNKERIVIYGDYDVDGVTSTAILYHAICCADPDANVRTYVPHRLDEGYGLNDEAMRTLAGEGTDLLVTVDCGISAVASAQLACDLGMDLIITDHHSLPGDGELPPAYARVHPRLPGSQYPFGDLCGAGVAFKLAWSFAVAWCGNERVSTAFRELLLECLPLAALGTVADVVPLLDENRTIVSVGLSRIRQSRLEGVQALINVSDLKGEKIDSYKVGFVLGPRLNACGRMGHAKEAIELLTTAKGKRAEEIANRINNLNKKRQQTERQILNTAVKMAEEQNLVSGNSRIIALAHEDWHPGVVGIVCSRMVDRYRRPTILMGRDGDICTGSARSIPGFSIYDALAGVSDNLLTYGGHEMAAGLSCRADYLQNLQQDLQAYGEKYLPEDLMTPQITIDCTVHIPELTAMTVRLVEKMSPFGRGNPPARLLLSNVRITSPPEVIGRQGKHLVLRVAEPGNNRVFRLIGFGFGEFGSNFAAGQTVSLVFEPSINSWNNRETVEGKILDAAIGDVSCS